MEQDIDKLQELVNESLKNGDGIGKTIHDIRFKTRGQYHPRDIHSTYLQLKQGAAQVE